MITRIRVKNYRSLEDVDVTLGALNVLVGKNAVGKSSFLDALRLIRDALNGSLEDAISERHGIALLRRWAPTKPYDIEIGVEIASTALTANYSFILASAREGAFLVKRESAEIKSADGASKDAFEVRSGKWTNPPKALADRKVRAPDPTALTLNLAAILSPHFARLKSYLRRTSFYNIYPNTLRMPQKPSPQKSLTDHGENVASTLKNLGGPQQKQRIVEALGKVAEGVCDFRVRPLGGYLLTELQHRVGEESPWFDLSQESDGTLRMLGILTALYQGKLSSLVAIEEPELTLHPGALAVLSEVIKESAGRNQIILTTQSPDLIARFSAEDLRVVERKDGRSSIGAVSKAQLEALNQQLFSTSDLIRIEGLKVDMPSQ